ncbi:hypothetical protein [Flavobacterium sp. N2270]|uniref:hypothetical protein n=1 Tax=Flavobacterium sp. N2270 TaxID=2986831 RepID=UPI00222474F6|nr:hypothetical protein [Flavobacterium sp. N2270]
MKKIYLSLTVALCFCTTNAQVGIGTTNPQAFLDLNSNTQGVLISKVALTSRNIELPVVNPQGGGVVEGTLVYNTSTSGVAPLNVSPGFYFWDGTFWVAMDGLGGRDWSLLGNSGTNPVINFLGTTDNTNLIFRTNNLQRAVVRSDGNVAINSPGDAWTKLYVNTTGAFNDALRGRNDDTVGNALWATNINDGGTSVLGGSGAGGSIYPSTGAGVAGSGPYVGVYGTNGYGSPSNTSHYSNSGGGFSLDSDNNTATLNNSAFAKIAGIDNISPDGSLASRRSLYGGYFNAGVGAGQAYAYVGIKYNANAAGGGGTNYKIIGNGTNSTMIIDEDNKPRVLFSPEAPEILFEDYGTSQLVNGEVYVTIDPVLKKALYVDEKHPLKVFIQLEGDCAGVFVTDKSVDGFKVKELARGTSNVKFSWHIVANRADDKDSLGNVTSEHVGLRLPYGPIPIKETQMSNKKFKTNESISMN